jgi:hypothetical protein
MEKKYHNKSIKNIIKCKIIHYFFRVRFEQKNAAESLTTIIMKLKMLQSNGKILKTSLLFAALFISLQSDVSAQNPAGCFPIISNGQATPLYISGEDWSGVQRAFGDLQTDLQKVSGNAVTLSSTSMPRGNRLVVAGTIGMNPEIDALVNAGKIDLSEIEGQWEAYHIEVVEEYKGYDEVLVIAGSDKRGTIFGIYEISNQIGVSPWYFWADVPVEQQENVSVVPGCTFSDAPKIKYRGIFLNDEAPALRGWAQETFGDFNSEFYKTVYELILRQKANYLWPAMWRPSVFATDDPLNPQVADEYGVVISTTHHEPMMRYHEEWGRSNGGEWNYETNPERLREFWKEGIERMGDHESVVTLGMRGDGDEAMGEDTAVELLKNIIDDQRDIIEDVTGKPAEETPQVWALYKEVQDYYDKGMRVADDILVLFCDDNWGNVRILPKKDDLDHEGGYGMYYHFDFVGGPVSYRWINVTQIERVWEQMKLSYEWGVEDLWIVNVGDLKPMELPISLFLDMAWNPDMEASELPGYYVKWATQQFGSDHAEEIAELLALGTKYSARRTPEMIQPETYSLFNYREADRILDEYDDVFERSTAVYNQLPEDQKDAFYQLVHFPIEISKNLNEMYIAARKNEVYGNQSRASTNYYADLAKEKFFNDAALTEYYHTELANGKWNHMMSQTRIGYTSWNNPPVNKMPELSYIQTPTPAGIGYVVEHGANPNPWVNNGLYGASFPTFDPVNDQEFYLEVFNRGTETLNYTVQPQNEWISVSEGEGSVQFEERVFVSIDWSKTPKGTATGELVLSGAGQRFTIQVPIRNNLPAAAGFVENNGLVSIEAHNFTNKVETDDIRWTVVPNLGKTSSALIVEPMNADAQVPGANTPHVEYEFTVFEGGDFTVETYLSPTLNYKKEEGLKFAIAIDGEEPQIINVHEGDNVPDWEYPEWWNTSVTDRIRIKTSTHSNIEPGTHTLKVWMVDPGLVFQKFLIDGGGTKPSYLGPPESTFVDN